MRTPRWPQHCVLLWTQGHSYERGRMQERMWHKNSLRLEEFCFGCRHIGNVLRRLCTHSNEIRLSFGPEVPFYGGGGFHLAPFLAGDAAQFETLPCHRLCVGVHLRAGPMTLVHCCRKTQIDNQYAWLTHWTDTKRWREEKLIGQSGAVQDFPQHSSMEDYYYYSYYYCSLYCCHQQPFIIGKNIWCTHEHQSHRVII